MHQILTFDQLSGETEIQSEWDIWKQRVFQESTVDIKPSMQEQAEEETRVAYNSEHVEKESNGGSNAEGSNKHPTKKVVKSPIIDKSE